MSDVNSSTPAPAGKPAQPCLDFPLFPHAADVWAEKTRGKLFNFGPWSDPDGTLHAGRKPRPETEGLTIADLGTAFLDR